MNQNRKSPMVFEKATSNFGLIFPVVILIAISVSTIFCFFVTHEILYLVFGVLMFLLFGYSFSWMIWKVASDGDNLHLYHQSGTVTTIPWREITGVTLEEWSGSEGGTSKVLTIAHGNKRIQLDGKFSNDQNFVETMTNFRKLRMQKPKSENIIGDAPEL